jgi:hypothetical protein
MCSTKLLQQIKLNGKHLTLHAGEFLYIRQKVLFYTHVCKIRSHQTQFQYYLTHIFTHLKILTNFNLQPTHNWLLLYVTSLIVVYAGNM